MADQDQLKFITCGSVDDGKSTLIGHLLYDAKLIYADQKRALELDSKAGSRAGKLDYSLLLDGLTEEREQGITIDVAYRYFKTERRSFIVADCPGHEEYTRNMAVGASFAQLAVILIDATKGVLVQTRRHARICALVGVRHFLFAVNKMDLAGYDEAVFRKIEAQVGELAGELGLESVALIPISATEGDNVTRGSSNMPWYAGPAVLGYLEGVDVSPKEAERGFYLPVQRVCRPDHTFRGFEGEVACGAVGVGDELTVLPSRERACVRRILRGDDDVQRAQAGDAVTVQLDREVDVTRGCVLEARSGALTASALAVDVLWMDDEPLHPGSDYLVKLGCNRIVPGQVTGIDYAVEVNTGEHKEPGALAKNELARVRIALLEPVPVDAFSRHRTLGELILIDRVSNATSAAGVVREAGVAAGSQVLRDATPQTRARQKAQRPLVAGFDAAEFDAGTVAAIEARLELAGRHTYLVADAGALGAGELAAVTEALAGAGLVVLVVADLAGLGVARDAARRVLGEKGYANAVKLAGTHAPDAVAAALAEATAQDGELDPIYAAAAV